MLTTGGVAAQSPSASASPEATTAPTQTRTQPGMGGHRGFGRSGGQRGDFGGPMGGDFFGGPRGGDFFGPRGGGRGSWGGEFGGPGMAGARRGSLVTVASVDGSEIGLETADGWTRTIDATAVALTRDGVAITTADLLVGEPVRVVQTRNADGSYTVTGIEVQPSVVVGTVGTVSADGLTVVGSDGTTTTVTVTPETTWSSRGASSVTIADATAGRAVAVQGQLQADGSIVATKVRLG
jgi:hypothetical protein